MIPISLMPWLGQQLGSWVLKKGLDKAIPFFFRRDAVMTSISIAIKRTGSKFQSDSVEYLIRRVFGKRREMIRLIKMNYKTNPEIVLESMEQGLIDCGASFGNESETLEKIKEISKGFIDILAEELPLHEKVPVSTMQTAESTHRIVKDIAEQLNRMNDRISRQEENIESLDEESISSPQSKTSASFTKENDNELSNSVYKERIDDAKVLLDREQYEVAKVIYEKLLEDFKSDTQVPLLAKFKVYNNLGACLAALGMTTEAAGNFRIAFEVMGPTSLVACKNRALASFFEGKPLEGLPFIDAAIAIDPNDNDCVNLKATLLRAAHQFDKVIELYTNKGEQDGN